MNEQWFEYAKHALLHDGMGRNERRPIPWFRVAVTVTISTVFGGMFYAVWLAAFLQTAPANIALLQTALWLAAPVVTAAGFATGAYLHGRIIGRRGTDWGELFLWPLVGCTVGGGALYLFGPMLIVFGMLLAGALSIGLREIVMQRRIW